jgi:hypothetical protein
MVSTPCWNNSGNSKGHSILKLVPVDYPVECSQFPRLLPNLISQNPERACRTLNTMVLGNFAMTSRNLVWIMFSHNYMLRSGSLDPRGSELSQVWPL